MRLTGPGMSLGASGTMAKTLTFSIWKGQAYGRVRVIPKNPKSVLQKAVRSIFGTVSKAARVVLTLAMDANILPTGSQFFIDAIARAPYGQSWISWLQMVLNPVFTTIVDAFGVLTTVAALYETGAEDVGMGVYVDKTGDTHTPGEQMYMLAVFATSSLGYLGFPDGVDDATAPQIAAFGAYLHVHAV